MKIQNNNETARVRVARLFKGIDCRNGMDCRYEFKEILMCLRNKTYGEKFVREIADFAAHPKDRDKGVFVEFIDNIYNVINFQLKRIVPNNTRLDANRLSPSIVSFLKSSICVVNEEYLKKETGLNRKKAEIFLKKIEKELEKNDDGTFAWKLRYNDRKKIDLFNFCITRIDFFSTVLREDEFTSSFLRCLKHNEIVPNYKEDSLNKLNNFITLCLISMLHNSVIKLSCGEKCLLELGIRENKLFVYATMKHKHLIPTASNFDILI